MDVAAVFIAVFFVLVFVVAPLLGLEDRPEFLRPERKPRLLIGSWFRDRRYSAVWGMKRHGPAGRGHGTVPIQRSAWRVLWRLM
jgi:hypothetical protein